MKSALILSVAAAMLCLTSCMSGTAKTAKGGRELIAMGNNMLYIFDALKAEEEGDFRPAITWQWDAKSISRKTGIPEQKLDFIDECKVKERGKTLLVTGSHGWTAYLRKADRKLLFWADNTPQAHSAELLPGGRVVVACSVPENQIILFDLKHSNVELFRTPVLHAHGVFYSEKYERLFAVGENVLGIYRLCDWESERPRLELEETLSTAAWVTNIHDLIPLGEDTLVLAGKNAAFYDIPSREFISWSRFDGIGSIKSMNYNEATREIIYTYSNPQVCEGDYKWSTWKIRCSFDTPDAQETIIHTPGINGYKTRVYRW